MEIDLLLAMTRTSFNWIDTSNWYFCSDNTSFAYSTSMAGFFWWLTPTAKVRSAYPLNASQSVSGLRVQTRMSSDDNVPFYGDGCRPKHRAVMERNGRRQGNISHIFIMARGRRVDCYNKIRSQVAMPRSYLKIRFSASWFILVKILWVEHKTG